MRSCPAANEVVREVCGNYGVPMADADKDIAALSGGPATGSRLFLDSCHMVPQAMEAIGLCMARTAASQKAKIFPDLPTPPAQAVPGPAQYLPPSAEDGSGLKRAQNMVKHCLSDATCCFEPYSMSYFNQLIETHPEYIAHITANKEDYIEYTDAFFFGPGNTRNGNYASAAGNWPNLLWLIGEGYRQAGDRAKAREYLAMAGRAGMKNCRLPISLALLAADDGDTAAARGLWGEAARLAATADEKQITESWRAAALGAS